MARNDRTLRLGLIGGNITASRSPALHVVCGLSVWGATSATTC